MLRRAPAAAVAALGFTMAGCSPSPSASATASPDATFNPDDVRLRAFAPGSYRWLLYVEADDTVRVEDERWRLWPNPSGLGLQGRYHREVVVHHRPGAVFACNHASSYRQRADYDVVIEPSPRAGWQVRETRVQVEAGPCDHGFRKLTSYPLELGRRFLTLRFDRGDGQLGVQTLVRVADDLHAPDRVRGPTDHAISGRWTLTTDDGRAVTTETWDLARVDDARLTGTVRRTLAFVPPPAPQEDGLDADLAPTADACGAWPPAAIEETIALELDRDPNGRGWQIREVDATARQRPCQAALPARVLDSGILTPTGPYLTVVWRGNRRTVLQRSAVE